MSTKNTSGSSTVIAGGLFIFLLFTSPISKGEVVISGKLLGINFSGYILYNEPVDGHATLYLNEKNVRCNNNGSFERKSKIQKAGFINIKLPGKTLWLFVEPDDTISFKALFSIDNKLGRYIFKDIFFKGKNAAGHRGVKKRNNQIG